MECGLLDQWNAIDLGSGWHAGRDGQGRAGCTPLQERPTKRRRQKPATC